MLCVVMRMGRSGGLVIGMGGRVESAWRIVSVESRE